MKSIMFVTCDVSRAIKFMQNEFPKQTIKAEEIPKMCKLINDDILRVTDPAMHGTAKIICTKNYNAEYYKDAVQEAVKEFGEKYTHITEF